MACSAMAIFVTIGIIFSLILETIRFLKEVSLLDFLFGTKWSPQMAMREDQVASAGAFGALPLITGTLLISSIALAVAAPFGVYSAIYLVEYAPPKWRSFTKPALEILAGIPTVVYGFFAAIVIAPSLRTVGGAIGLDIASQSALAAGLVMGVMMIPLVSSLSDDVIRAVPQSLRDASLAMGATKSETIKQVVIPAALPGIASGILLAASRAIGETMIVVMAAGLAANFSFNPLEAVTTVTVQIVMILTGDQEFDSTKTLAAFALGLMLLILTLILNILSRWIVHKYQEKYD
jgi:phosphate transport system permease protein